MLMTNLTWPRNAVFYHLYPLGSLDAPRRQLCDEGVTHRLRDLEGWLDYLEELGVDALLLGPVMQSSSHGYDITDYVSVDRRLGDEEDLAAFSRALHQRGMRLVLDAVFHHTGRDFPAFQDVLRNGEASAFCGWYYLDFSRSSAIGDAFHYEGWAGHYDLVKLNLQNPEVRQHLFAAVDEWIERFDVDGLRLDAADRLDPAFRADLAAHCRAIRPDFWLMGEVVHGDYRQWAGPEALSSTTNYEAYKGLWSSHNDRNYFEIAYTLNRQFGADGLYRGLDLYSFADNHDVDRVASSLADPGFLYPLYILLMTMPGIPSIYYGSEWGIAGQRTQTSDTALRPALHPEMMRATAEHPDLFRVLKNLIRIRHHHEALRSGEYMQLHVASEQFAFSRGRGPGAVVVVVNAAEMEAQVTLAIPETTQATDLLNAGATFAVSAGQCTMSVPPRWGRILSWPDIGGPGA